MKDNTTAKAVLADQMLSLWMRRNALANAYPDTYLTQGNFPKFVNDLLQPMALLLAEYGKLTHQEQAE